MLPGVRRLRPPHLVPALVVPGVRRRLGDVDDDERPRHRLRLHGHPQGRWARGRDAVPYVVAYVELDEGPRVLTNVVTDDPDAVHDRHWPSTAIFVPVDDPATGSPATHLLRFTPAR